MKKFFNFAIFTLISCMVSNLVAMDGNPTPPTPEDGPGASGCRYTAGGFRTPPMQRTKSFLGGAPKKSTEQTRLAREAMRRQGMRRQRGQI